jgi:hypothetical protein
MNSIDVVKQALSTMKFQYSVQVEPIDHNNDYYIQVHGIKHTHKLWGTPTKKERIARIELDSVLVFAYDYDISSIPGPVDAVDGAESTLYLADPDFFVKLETAINGHIEWLIKHKI